MAKKTKRPEGPGEKGLATQVASGTTESAEATDTERLREEFLAGAPVEDPVAVMGQAAGTMKIRPGTRVSIKEYLEMQPVTIEVPLGPLPEDADLPRHVDVQLRSRPMRESMRRIFTGLDLTGARTADGRRVTNNVEAVRWLLEQVTAAVESG